MDDKRDKKALGLALITVPIAVVSGVSGVDSASAANSSTTPEPAPEAGAANFKAAATSPSSSIVANNQLTYTVRAGDTATSIARKFKLSTNQLLAINKLKSNSLIVPGQKLRLIADAVLPQVTVAADGTKSHVVKTGETIASIAKKHSIAITTILAMNNIKASTLIFPGQKLIIGTVVTQEAPVVIATEHVVETGETLASIAKRYSMSLDTLLSLNGMNESTLLFGGQTLKLRQTAVANDSPPQSVAPISSLPLLSDVNVAAPNSNTSSISSDPHRPSAVCQIHGYHTVKMGESISKIAAVYGVTTQSVLAENSLGWSSTIFIGQRLVIPGVHQIQHCPDITKLSAEMKSNAQVIFKVGRSLGVSDYGIVIALATAMQESGLRNLSYGDRDSVGLFQQRPSAHWGSTEKIMNPEYAARAFFGGPTSPTYGAARGLLDIKDWSDRSLTQAAQAVQISAYPNAYAKWEISAWLWLDELNGALIDE